MLTDTQRFLFDLQGFIVLENVLDQDRIGAINSIIDGAGLPSPGDAFADQVFAGFLTWGEPIRALLDHAAVQPLLTELVGRPRLDRYYGLRMRNGTTGLPLHGGSLAEDDPSEFYSVRNGKMTNGIVTVSWALTDMLEGQGGFVCIPGSHKSDFSLPAGWDHTAPAARLVPLHAGDVLIFTGSIVHGTYPWTARHERRSIMFKYAPRHLASSPVYLKWSEDLLNSLTPSQRSLFDPPSCGTHPGDPTDRFVR